MNPVILNIIYLIAGFAALIIGADTMVKGAASLAAKLKIPSIVIGLTIVAIGTSAPELVVNIISSFKGESALAFGNVIGSNIFNILCVLGITSMVYSLKVNINTARIEIPLVIFSAVLILIMFGKNIFNSTPTYFIGRIEGVILIVMFLLFIGYTIRLSLKKHNKGAPVKTYTIFISIVLLLAGLAGLIFGGRLLVSGAVSIAEMLGVSQRIIAITIVSVGTSLPELATSIAAARKRNIDMAVGNVVGSNLMNVFLVLGASAIIKPINLSFNVIVDVVLNIVVSVLMLLFVFTGRGRRIERWEGILLFLLYITYITYLILY